jgi:hypothetical protein
MLSQFFDLIVNIIVVIFIIFVLNLFITRKIHDNRINESFLNEQFPNKLHYPKAVNDINNNEYNELLNYIYKESGVFANNAPINDRLGEPNQHNNNEMLKDMLIQNKINTEPNSDMPYNDQVNNNSLSNNNLLNNANNEIKAQIPQYIEQNKQNSELLNSDIGSNDITGFSVFDNNLNSQFETLL